MTVKSTGMHIEGAHQLLRTISRMDKELTVSVRAGAFDIADRFLTMVSSEASAPAEHAAVDAMKVYKDRFPKVGFPATRKAGVSGGAKVGELFFGWEFGGGKRSTTQQFPSSPDGFFYPVLRSEGEELALDWFDIIGDALATEWNKGARAAEVGL